MCWQVIRDGGPIDLSPIEFRLLLYFVRNPGRVITRAELLRGVAGSTTAASVVVIISALCAPLRAGEPICTEIWNNYKDSRFWIYPDRWGHQGAGGSDPGDEWDYEYSLGSTGNEFHTWFEDSKAEEQHSEYVCAPGGGSN